MSQETLESRCAHLLFHGDDSEQLSTLLLLGQIEQQQQQQQQALGTLGIDADGVEGVEVGMGEVVGGQTGPQGVLSFPRRLVPGTDRTLLMACAKQGRTQCLRLLISMLLRNQGVDQQTAQGYSALHYAAYAGHIPALDALLSAGASLSLRNQAGETAYDAAVAGGRWEAAGLFEAHPRFALAQAQARMQRQMQTQMQSPVQTQVPGGKGDHY
ncbi:hypothetical protein B484DRAFT_212781 [Ochromonadaceae sp. CCMP2298]|nr:hypothetical protein B484DRAFT_212781 [Ochromonadaceae sp. CCMP2298]